MPNICARYGLKDVDELLNKLNEPSEAQSIVNVLRNNNKATPDARTIQQMYYRKRLVRAGIVQNILSAIQEQLRKNGEIGFDELLRLQDHTLEFNCRVLKLGSTIDEGEQKRLDPENGIIANVARHVGCDEIIISNMSQGHQCLVPEDFAVSVCKATMMACQLSEPLEFVRHPANEARYKPLAFDSSRKAHECEKSVVIRQKLFAYYHERRMERATLAAE